MAYRRRAPRRGYSAGRRTTGYGRRRTTRRRSRSAARSSTIRIVVAQEGGVSRPPLGKMAAPGPRVAQF